ncbi:hypothetical protein CRUP_011260 [Coryphaenoides rupestris]|nr:hypothetical protein CRUP_011260 [Coryphaenoides rupestris]
MKELSITRAAARVQLQKSQYLQLGQNRGQYYGGSLPNVNQIGNGTVDVGFQNSEVDSSRTTRHHGLVDRVYRDRNRNASPHRKPLPSTMVPTGVVAAGVASAVAQQQQQQQQQQALFTGGSQELQPKRVLLLTVPMNSRSKPCKVPGINIFPSPDQELSASLIPAAHNTGGSLPDLSNIQFPPPLPTPLDTDDPAASPLSTSTSMGNLVAATQTGLNSSQPVVSMETQPGQDDMVPLILSTIESNSQGLQLSPNLSPPLSLSQAAINAMALEQQLSQYAFFSQQTSPQSHQSPPQTGLIQLPSSLVQNQSSASTTGNQMSTQSNMMMDINMLEQFNMMESPVSSSGLYSQASTLNYTQAAMMGLTAGHCNPQDLQQLGYSSHGNIPNIILTVSGESPPGLPKDLVSSLSTDISFDVDSPFPLDELKIDPLTLDGLHMLNDPDMLLADAATEDAFRLDRL